MFILVRRAALLAAGPLVAGSLVATAAPAQAAPTTPPTAEATAAATWLDGKLVDGLLSATPAEAGSTIDLGLSLVVTGASPATVSKVRSGIDSVLTAYTDGTAGATAKAAYFYEAIGGDASKAGASADVDLVASLEEYVDDETGRLGSTSDVYSQVYAVQALREVGSDETGAATDFLIDQRCPGAGWGYEYMGCNSDVDATAAALLALQPFAGTPDVDAAITAGVTWLEAQQAADGGFGFGGEGNANSTGLAGWALGTVGRSASAVKAAGWVAAHQVVALPACGATKADADHGAIAYDQADLDAARQTGITAETLQTWKFASAQALAALAYLPASSPAVSAPAGYVAAGSSVAITVAGLRAGEAACLSGAGTATKVTGPGTISVALPATTADHTVTLSTVGKPVTTTVKALGSARFKVQPAKRVEKGKKQKAKISKLAPGEKVVVRVNGKKVDKGTANGAGVFKTVFKATGKPGKRKLTVDGQFDDRSGKATFKVVR